MRHQVVLDHTANAKTGAVFSIVPNTGVEHVVYSFWGRTYCADGRDQPANLIEFKGTLYCTTDAGGS